MSTKIFISYSHVDIQFAAQVANMLNELGIDYFFDKKIKWGESIPDEIKKALSECTEVLLILSPASINSPYVQREIGQAEALGKTILPFLTHPSIPIPFGLSHIKYITGLEDAENYFQDLAKSLSAPFTFVSLPSAEQLPFPRSAVNLNDEFPKRKIKFGPITLNEVAMILEPIPGTIWTNSSIAWRYQGVYDKLNPFWTKIDQIDPLHNFNESDRVPGKHVRLAAAGLMRHPQGFQMGIVWQRLSWENSRKTNGRVARNILYKNVPIRRWFREKDLLTPPLESDDDLRDPPFGNRFAVNLAVIVRSQSGNEYALFHERSSDLACYAEGIESGISESVHGDRGWPETERDIIDNNPDLLRTARRCLWQELGISENGTTHINLPGFNINLFFTALVLNKLEFTPRLLGYVVIFGDLQDIEESNRKSLELKVLHKEFGFREVKDAVIWEKVHWIKATPAGLLWVLKQNTLSPECRARLIFYLKHRFGTQNVVEEVERYYNLSKRPDWWRS